MTAVPKDPAISELRELFRHLREFRVVYELTGQDEIVTPAGNRWSLWDLEYLLEIAVERLSQRQRQAIVLCLVHNMREKDAAVRLGVSQTNPVMMYATQGLRNLLMLVDRGDLDRFRQAKTDRGVPLSRRAIALEKLARSLREVSRFSAQGCWVYPTQSFMHEPWVNIPSVATLSGWQRVHAAYVTFEYYVRPVPRTHLLVHELPAGHYFKACINPGHFQPELRSEEKERQQVILRRYLAQRNAMGTVT